MYAKIGAKQSGLVLTGGDMTAVIDPRWLRELPLLEGVDTESLKEMVPWFGTDHFRRNHVIVYEHDPGTKFYIVVRGKVEVTRAAPDGSSIVVAVLQDGDYFGEMALLNNRLRNATVRTLIPT